MSAQTVASVAGGWVPEQDFAVRLLLARRHLGLTVREAALRCGVHYATWSTWERGSKPHDMAAAVQAVANGLGVDRSWLLWGESDNAKDLHSTWYAKSPLSALRSVIGTESRPSSITLVHAA